MSPAWADNLDMLALSGALDFDAPSYITGQAPRYVGSIAHTPSPFVGPMPKNKKLEQPQVDEFQYEKSNKNDKFSVPTWKKWLFGGLAAGALILGGWKFKSKLLPHLKNLTSKFKLDKVKDFFKNGWNKFTNLFHKKKSISP